MSTTTKAESASMALEQPVNAYLLARTYAEVTRERCNVIQRSLLESREYHADPKFCDPPYRIADPKETYLICDELRGDYFSRMDAAYRAAGWTDLEPGHCPACTAEYLQTQAEWAIIEAAEPFFPGVTNDRLLSAANGLERRQEYIDLCVKLVVNRPGFVAPTIPSQRQGS